MFTVAWVGSALNDLMNVWMDADSPQRKAITSATHQIDAFLRYNPREQGESRAGGRRILLVPPLGILFSVKPQDRIVRVLSVWRFEKRNRER